MSVIPAAYTALVDIMTAALPDVQVRSGQVAQIATKPEMLYIGCQDPTVAGPWVAIEQGDQEFISLGAAVKKETFRIWMCLVVNSGSSDDTTFPKLLTTSDGLIADIESALRQPPIGTGDGQLGGVLGDAGWCSVSILGFSQGMSLDGTAVLTPIAVDCTHYDHPH